MRLSPGPLAAQLGMYLGYLRARVLGATLVDHPTVCLALGTLSAPLEVETHPRGADSVRGSRDWSWHFSPDGTLEGAH